MLNLDARNQRGWERLIVRFQHLLPAKWKTQPAREKQLARQSGKVPDSLEALSETLDSFSNVLRSHPLHEVAHSINAARIKSLTNKQMARRLIQIRNEIRRAWENRTLLGRQVTMYTVVSHYLWVDYWGGKFNAALRSYVDNFLPELPDSPTDPFLLVLMQAVKNVERMRCCANPSCPAPYFLAVRRTQKYCDRKCAEPSQREFKKKWWKKYGRRARQRAKRRN